jgi:predicted nucleotidyltransferase
MHELLEKPEYRFVHKYNPLLIGYGGSIAYGTNTPTSDTDVRGVLFPFVDDILIRDSFEQVEDKTTDTVLYALKKFCSLCANCNPNVIELLGLKKEHYLVVSEFGKELIENADMFLSKKAIHTFGGYASSQLRRLTNKESRQVSQAEEEQHILNSINNMMFSFADRYADYAGDINLYIDVSSKDELDSEIYMDISLKGYPLRDWLGMWSEMKQVTNEYAKVSRRSPQLDPKKLAKHQMHLVRLFYTAFDILEDGKIVTYREKEHDFLMDIRNGKYLDGMFVKPEFYEVVDELEHKLESYKEKSCLPKSPDYDRINAFIKKVNKYVIANDV